MTLKGDGMMAVTTEDKVVLIENMVVELKRIYDGVDNLNGYLDDLLMAMKGKEDTPEYRMIHDFYMRFPTYHELDSLEDTLNEVSKDMVKGD
jgi:hypothetical protein